jgi:hypothetical protein
MQQTLDEVRYLFRLPERIEDQVLVHNHARPTRQLGRRGFRAWLQAPSAGLEPCPCGWAAELGQHYRRAILNVDRPPTIPRTGARGFSV